MAFCLVFINFGKLLDELPQLGRRNGKEGEESVQELCGGDVRSTIGGDAIAKHGRFDRVILK